MHTAFVMLVLLTQTPEGERLYKEPLIKSLEAYYQGSEVKQLVDLGADKVRKEYPKLVTTATTAYALGVQKKIALPNLKIINREDTRFFFYADKSSTYGGVTFRF